MVRIVTRLNESINRMHRQEVKATARNMKKAISYKWWRKRQTNCRVYNTGHYDQAKTKRGVYPVEYAGTSV